MKTYVQTLKENPGHYFRLLILLCIIGAAGWLARFTLVIGFAKRIEYYPIMVLYIPLSVILLWMTSLEKFPSVSVLLAGLAVSMAYTGLCFAVNANYSENVPLCALTAAAEILLFCLAEFGLRKEAGKPVNALRLLLKGLVLLFLALAIVRLAYREQIRLLPFYRTGTIARAALRSEIMIGVSNVTGIIFLLWFSALFITERIADNTSLRRLTALVFLAPLAIIVMLLSKQVLSGTTSMSFTGGGDGGYRIDVKDPLWCTHHSYLYSENTPRGTEEVPFERTLICISDSYEASQKNKTLYTFHTAAGTAHMDNLTEKKYVTTFADEVILVNGDQGWQFLTPARTAGMAGDTDLLDAIRDGIENGRLLLAVDCLDYLRRYDPDYAADLLARWSRGSFTEGETSRGEWFDLAYFTQWAGDRIH